MALGSCATGIFRLVLWQGVRLVAAGPVIGDAISVATGRLVQSMLYDVQASDPLVFLLVWTVH
jgi:hypothetical protein